MKTIISIFRNLMISYRVDKFNRQNNVTIISEKEFNQITDKTKPIIYIS